MTVDEKQARDALDLKELKPKLPEEFGGLRENLWVDSAG